MLITEHRRSGTEQRSRAAFGTAWLLALHAVVAICILPTGGSVLLLRRPTTQVDVENGNGAR